MSVLLETSLGVFVVDLYCKERPRCSLNFIKLCKMKMYNFCLFHSVQKNLVAQSGDPSGTGRGGVSFFQHLYGDQAKYFDAEKEPKISHSKKGLVSMVDNGSGQHGSQFFITLGDELSYLDSNHTVFGYVAEGNDVIKRINDAYCDKNGRPYRNIRIHHTIILDDPFEDPFNITYPESPKRFSVSLSESSRLEEDEQLDETEGLSPKQMEELKASQEATTHAQLLTLIGDLPDVDAKPPENVLFVCRLNPITTSEDLEIIFSRFGEIKSCEVIRDRRTNASLQYAFVEFEKKEDCETALFKMDKVVIDDRRIHVDFSQSVVKEWQSYRNKKREVLLLPPQRKIGHSSDLVRHQKTHNNHHLERSFQSGRHSNETVKPHYSHSSRNPLKRPARCVESKQIHFMGDDFDVVVSADSDSFSESDHISDNFSTHKHDSTGSSKSRHHRDFHEREKKKHKHHKHKKHSLHRE